MPSSQWQLASPPPTGTCGAPGEFKARSKREALAEQKGRREVCLDDEPLDTERDVAERGEVVEVEVAGPRLVELRLRAPKLLVLHLQLDLVDAKLVQQSPRALRRERLVEVRIEEVRQSRAAALGAGFGALPHRIGGAIRAGREVTGAHGVPRWSSRSVMLTA